MKEDRIMAIMDMEGIGITAMDIMTEVKEAMIEGTILAGREMQSMGVAEGIEIFDFMYYFGKSTYHNIKVKSTRKRVVVSPIIHFSFKFKTGVQHTLI